MTDQDLDRMAKETEFSRVVRHQIVLPRQPVNDNEKEAA